MSDVEMSFLEHLDEFRRRLISSVLVLVVATLACYLFFEPILDFIKSPLPDELKDLQFTVFGFMQVFMVRFKLAIIGGFILTSPYIIYQVLAFFAPAFQEKERKYVFTILPVMVTLFFSGVAFAFYVVLPAAITWLYGQGQGQLEFLMKADDYIGFVSLFLISFGVVFEAPLVIVLLIKLGIVERRKLRENWRIVYVASFVIAAIATPDWSIVSMSILGVVLVLLFELSMLFTRWL
ncbi:MAG: twin-arginine translocase subunit TatC [Actinobacteria bacterium]|nr:twin-arginine translocase subunit TatC [Actinomycetota bacterium]